MFATLERLLTFPNRCPTRPLGIPPSRDPIAFESVTIVTADGERLDARWHPAGELPISGESPISGEPRASARGYVRSRASAAFPNPRSAVLFCHGNGGTLPRWRHAADRWRRILGADVLLFSYRGYGRSTGSPSEAGLYEDARAAHAWLRETVGPDAPLVLVGQSLGGAVAVELATTAGCDALVLESTFTRIGDVPRAWPGGSWLASKMTNRFVSIEKLRGFDRPLFVSHGTRDFVIPHRHADELAAVVSGPVEMFKISGMTHRDTRGEDYEVAVERFLTATLKPEP